jgi:uroporphyrinogen-III synthase
MNRKLEGARIVVTRPEDGQERLARLLAAEGARVLAFPALEIVPLAAAGPAGVFDAALFTSPAAARLGTPKLGTLPSEVLAPGQGTQTALAEAGVKGVLAPQAGAGIAALLAGLSAKRLAGKRLLYVCGEPANRTSLLALEAAGAKITLFAVYARRAAGKPEPLAGWIRHGEADVIMASSVAAVEALLALPKTGVDRIGWIASSARVAGAIAQAGAKTAATGASAEAEDMLSAAIQWWQSRDT